MYTNYEKRHYSLSFSEMPAVSVRRLAWFLKVPMSKAVDQAVNLLLSLFSPGGVCPPCKDNTKCKVCVFGQQSSAAPAVPAV
jgi:hypothetical protein